MIDFKATKIARLMFGLVIFLLIVNIVYLGVTGIHLISGNNIAEFALSRSEKETINYATRGKIQTSDGEIIATNVKKYKMIAIVDENRVNSKDEAAYVVDSNKTAIAIAPLIGMDVMAMETKLEKAKNDGLFQVEFGVYGTNLTVSTKNAINALKLPGIEFTEFVSRNYPLGDFASYLIGYSQNEELNGYSSIVGKMGIELIYNDELRGKNGYSISQVDSKGYDLPNGIIEKVDSQDGHDIIMTVHSTIQRDLDIEVKKVYEQMDASFVSAAVMEVKTGKMLGITNYPSFDPNIRDVENYNDFFVNTLYEPGSVIKPFVYANAIEDGRYVGHDTFVSGQIKIDDATVRDWNNGVGFGTISYDTGLAMSSNVGIANLVTRVNDRNSLIEDYEQLGFFEDLETDIGISQGGYTGYNSTERDLELVTAGFGQGMTTTSLHILRAYSAFFNDGKMVTPYFIDKIVDPQTNEVSYSGKTEYSNQIYSPNTVTKMQQLLLNNVNGEQNVANAFTMDQIEVMGKTGTAQIASSSGYLGDEYIKSFIGIAPYDNPDIMVYVVARAPSYSNSNQMGELTKNIFNNVLSMRQISEEESITSVTMPIDSYVNQSIDYALKQLSSHQNEAIVIGDGGSVIDQYPEAYQKVSSFQKVFLKTNGQNITLPDFTNWTRKDISTYCEMINIKVEFSGNGVCVSQNIEAKTIIQQDQILNIILE